MKEWLNTKTYEYKQAACAPCSDDWVEVPKGMNFAYKDEFNVHFTKMEMGYRDSFVIWQRPTQPEELPFIDDEPRSLNDQYAEIEQVRQQTIEQTLAERGSRYGDFESVAETTRALMRILEDADRFSELSSAQYEALHMICSKMARIANGDPDYIDNWHDIAGYAKLVEDTI